MAESKEELKNLLKLNNQKTKIMESGSITSWQIERGIMEIVENFIWGVLKSLQTVIAP